jgi:hypothetical protein
MDNRILIRELSEGILPEGITMESFKSDPVRKMGQKNL